MAKRKDEPELKDKPISDALVFLVLFALLVLTVMFCGLGFLVYIMLTEPDARAILRDYGRDILGLLIFSMAGTAGGVVVIIKVLVSRIAGIPPDGFKDFAAPTIPS